jgi:hypothetical protein
MSVWIKRLTYITTEGTMRGRDFTKAERALQVIAAMAGVDLAELNKALEEDQEFRRVPR